MFTQSQISIILNALNSHEGVVSTDYERALRLNSPVLARVLSRDLADIRAVAALLTTKLSNTDDLVDVGHAGG